MVIKKTDTVVVCFDCLLQWRGEKTTPEHANDYNNSKVVNKINDIWSVEKMYTAYTCGICEQVYADEYGYNAYINTNKVDYIKTFKQWNNTIVAYVKAIKNGTPLFNLLEFKPRHTTRHTSGYQAKYYFANGYGVSVLNGWGYSDLNQTYELAIYYKGYIVYDTGITKDVVPYQTQQQIDTLMRKVKQLPPR
jgi:hypothetical protein